MLDAHHNGWKISILRANSNEIVNITYFQIYEIRVQIKYIKMKIGLETDFWIPTKNNGRQEYALCRILKKKNVFLLKILAWVTDYWSVGIE